VNAITKSKEKLRFPFVGKLWKIASTVHVVEIKFTRRRHVVVTSLLSVSSLCRTYDPVALSLKLCRLIDTPRSAEFQTSEIKLVCFKKKTLAPFVNLTEFTA